MREAIIFFYTISIAITLDEGSILKRQIQLRPRWVEHLEPCSVTCGGGVQRSLAECWLGDRRVNDLECGQVVRPASDSVPCGQKPCAIPKWVLTGWGSCSSKCGPGLKRRVARCIVDDGPNRQREVDDRQCSPQSRPREEVDGCTSGVSVPCPPFASPDVQCFSPPCRTSSSDQGAGRPEDPDGDSGLRVTPAYIITFVLLLLTLVLL